MFRLSIASAIALSIGAAAHGETFRWASTTDPQSMDPHAVSSTPVLSFLNNVYEGLVRRGKDMSVEPALATEWAPIGNGEGWRFTLRQGVVFHDGATFNADDVIFSYERASSDASDVASWFAPVSEVIKVDEYTVDFMTTDPNPIFPDSIANWMIMDSDWAAANGAKLPAKEAENFATLNANGTGAFVLAQRQPGLKTTLTPHDDWWGEAEHNITSAEFTPIQNPATAVAALLSGDVDLINPVPIQDAARLAQSDGVQVIQGIEARVIMLGFPHAAETLKYTAQAGQPNPFLDVRVRQAVAHAVNVPAILQTIMRGNAEPAWQLVSAPMRGYIDNLEERPAYDVQMAKDLLAEAGYENGFSFGLKCTNDRYLNDESVCQAVVSMLAQIGLTAELDAMPVRNYWPELRSNNMDMFLLGWSPGTFDAEHPIRFIVATDNPEKKLGSWNFGGYSSARIDELLPQIQSEIDDTKRMEMLEEVTRIYQDEVAYVPLYVQPLIWGARDTVSLTQRPDDFLILRWIRIE
ncbi:ABC transporter substrate-binding protein [Oceaniglobus ichthyenteri]|uniref:ABC transporter substrate-binding protein n=1 Tax=Oceaniglobus ichthyenteri TaxID=2136177 RepID=UPI000D36BBD2|nr:ABC transporter substrate-binding protein [Oceaniglobus ichthyenteri]